MFFSEMIYRDVISLNTQGNPLPPKAAHRGNPDIEVLQGNHGVKEFPNIKKTKHMKHIYTYTYIYILYILYIYMYMGGQAGLASHAGLAGRPDFLFWGASGAKGIWAGGDGRGHADPWFQDQD